MNTDKTVGPNFEYDILDIIDDVKENPNIYFDAMPKIHCDSKDAATACPNNDKTADNKGVYRDMPFIEECVYVTDDGSQKFINYENGVKNIINDGEFKQRLNSYVPVKKNTDNALDEFKKKVKKAIIALAELL